MRRTLKNMFKKIFSSIILTSTILIGTFLLPTPASAASLTLGTAPDGSLIIYLEGNLDHEDGWELWRLLNRTKSQAQKVSHLVLDSPGGAINAGVVGALAILEHDLGVHVPDDAICASACFMLFIAGKEKYYSPGSRIGVHSATTILTGEDGLAKSVTVDMARFVKNLGATDAIISNMVTTTPGKMYWLTQEDLISISQQSTQPRNQFNQELQKLNSAIKPKKKETEGSKITNVDRRHSRTLNSQGIKEIRSNQLLQSVQTFEQAYELNPFDAEIAGNYGYSLYKTDQFEKAKYVLGMALKLKPKRGVTWGNLGQTFAALGDTDLATDSFVKYYRYSSPKDIVSNQLQKWATGHNTTPDLQYAAKTALQLLDIL